MTANLTAAAADAERIVANLGRDAQRFSGKTVLLAGGAGFLGRHFIDVFRYLLPGPGPRGPALHHSRGRRGLARVLYEIPAADDRKRRARHQEPAGIGA